MADLLAANHGEHVEECVDCARGAHRACKGRSTDHASDLRVPCPCRASGHAGGPFPLPATA